MQVRLASALVIALLGGCDPGGSYHLLGASNEHPNLVAGSSQTSLHARASWFTTSLHGSLQITNDGSTPLEVRPNELRMADRDGMLERKEGRLVRCETQDGDLVVLAPTETCEMNATFQVKVDRDPLKTVTLTHDGVTRDNVAVPISLTFEMN